MSDTTLPPIAKNSAARVPMIGICALNPSDASDASSAEGVTFVSRRGHVLGLLGGKPSGHHLPESLAVALPEKVGAVDREASAARVYESLVRPLLPRGGSFVVCGPPKSGKRDVLVGDKANTTGILTLLCQQLLSTNQSVHVAEATPGDVPAKGSGVVIQKAADAGKMLRQAMPAAPSEVGMSSIVCRASTGLCFNVAMVTVTREEQLQQLFVPQNATPTLMGSVLSLGGGGSLLFTPYTNAHPLLAAMSAVAAALLPAPSGGGTMTRGNSRARSEAEGLPPVSPRSPSAKSPARGAGDAGMPTPTPPRSPRMEKLTAMATPQPSSLSPRMEKASRQANSPATTSPAAKKLTPSRTSPGARKAEASPLHPPLPPKKASPRGLKFPSSPKASKEEVALLRSPRAAVAVNRQAVVNAEASARRVIHAQQQTDMRGLLATAAASFPTLRRYITLIRSEFAIGNDAQMSAARRRSELGSVNHRYNRDSSLEQLEEVRREAIHATESHARLRFEAALAKSAIDLWNTERVRAAALLSFASSTTTLVAIELLVDPTTRVVRFPKGGELSIDSLTVLSSMLPLNIGADGADATETVIAEELWSRVRLLAQSTAELAELRGVRRVELLTPSALMWHLAWRWWVLTAYGPPHTDADGGGGESSAGGSELFAADPAEPSMRPPPSHSPIELGATLRRVEGLLAAIVDRRCEITQRCKQGFAFGDREQEELRCAERELDELKATIADELQHHPQGYVCLSDEQVTAGVATLLGETDERPGNRRLALTFLEHAKRQLLRMTNSDVGRAVDVKFLVEQNGSLAACVTDSSFSFVEALLDVYQYVRPMEVDFLEVGSCCMYHPQARVPLTLIFLKALDGSDALRLAAMKAAGEELNELCGELAAGLCDGRPQTMSDPKRLELLKRLLTLSMFPHADLLMNLDRTSAVEQAMQHTDGAVLRLCMDVQPEATRRRGGLMVALLRSTGQQMSPLLETILAS